VTAPGLLEKKEAVSSPRRQRRLTTQITGSRWRIRRQHPKARQEVLSCLGQERPLYSRKNKVEPECRGGQRRQTFRDCGELANGKRHKKEIRNAFPWPSRLGEEAGWDKLFSDEGTVYCREGNRYYEQIHPGNTPAARRRGQKIDLGPESDDTKRPDLPSGPNPWGGNSPLPPLHERISLGETLALSGRAGTSGSGEMERGPDERTRDRLGRDSQS